MEAWRSFFFARRPSKMTFRPRAWCQNCSTLQSNVQVKRHAKWFLQCNISWIHKFAARPQIQHPGPQTPNQPHKTLNFCACHAKNIVADPLQIHSARRRFRNPQELLCRPRFLQRVQIPALAKRNAFWTLKSVPSTWCFNGLDFQIAFKGSDTDSSLMVFSSEPLSRYRMGQVYAAQLQKVLRLCHHYSVVRFLVTSWAADPSHLLVVLELTFQASETTKLWKNAAFRAIPTRQIPSYVASVLYHGYYAVKHVCCKTFLL